ncbi:MAG: hypothetical protein ABIJ61_14775, partial [bacterium]
MQSRERGRIQGLSLGLIVATTLVVCGGCSIEKPQAPSWDVNLIIPVINRSYTALELVERMSSEHLAVDSSGDLTFALEETLDTLYTDTLLRFDDISSQVLRQLGAYEITPPAPQTQSIRLADHLPLAAGEAPDTGVTVNLPLASLSTIAQAEIATGQLILTATNNTNLDFDSLTCEVRNNPGGTILVQTFPGGLAAGSSGQRTVSLAGETIPGEMNLEVFFHTPGGFTGSLADQELSLQIGFGGTLTVNSATAEVEQSTVDYTQTTSLDTRHEIQYAELASGELHYTVTNQLPIPGQLEVTFPEVNNGAGALRLLVDLPAYGQSTQSIALTDWALSPADNALAAEIRATVLGSEGQVVTMNSTDGFALDLTLSNLRLKSAQAIIAPTEVTWEPQSFAVDIPTGLDNATLATAELALTIQNSSELSGGLELVITADNGHSLTLSGAIAAGSAAAPANSVISTANVAQLLSPLPRSFTVSGVATVGDGFSLVEVSRLDNLIATAKITAPLRFVLAAETVEADIEA